jgi:curved DNA-binding protein CbpA
MAMTATHTSELRRAYATLVRHYHPDTSPGTASAAGLAAVQQLYRDVSRSSRQRSRNPYAPDDRAPRVLDRYA